MPQRYCIPDFLFLPEPHVMLLDDKGSEINGWKFGFIKFLKSGGNVGKHGKSLLMQCLLGLNKM